MSIIAPARFRLLLCGVLAVLAAAFSIGVASPGSAAAAPLRPGTGYRLPGGDFVGFYVTRGGVAVYCIDPGKRAPSSVSLTSISRYRGMSQRTAVELSYALATWGNATTKKQAATESQLINTIAGNAADVRRRAAHLPRSIATLVAAHLRAVHALHGPYEVSLRVAGAAAPGQSATASARVTAATGAGVAGVVIQLRASGNVTVPATVRTGAQGAGTFRFTVTGPGPVRIDATAQGLAPPRFIGTHPASGQQRMITRGHDVAASAQTGFEARLGAFSHRYACSTTCNGQPRTTVRACAVPSRYASRLVLRLGGSTQVLTYPAANRSTCQAITPVLADGVQVAAAWQFYGPHGWTQPVAASGAFVVDCPTVPLVQLALSYDCTQGTLAAAVVAPPAHEAVLVITGAASRRVEAAPGSTARFTAAVHCGTVQTYTVQAGVRRGDGGWNYGSAARIGTPGAARQA